MDHIVVIILYEEKVEGFSLGLLQKEVGGVLGRIEIVVFVGVLVTIDAEDIEQGVVEDNQFVLQIGHLQNPTVVEEVETHAHCYIAVLQILDHS